MLGRWVRGCVSRLSPCVFHLPFFFCDAGSESCLPLVLRSDARCCDAGYGVCGQMPDAVTLAPGGAMYPCVSQLLAPGSLSPQWSDARCCDAGSSQFLRSDARCCDAGSVWVPDAVTLGAGLCLPLVSLCLPSPVFFCDAGSESCLPLVLRSDARCCDAGYGVCGQMPDAVTLAPGGVLSPACLPVSPSRWLRGRVSRLSPSLCRCCDAGSGVVSPLSPCLSQSLQADARRCDAGSWVVSPACLPVCGRCACLASGTGVWLPSALFGSRGSSSHAQLRSIKLET